MPGDLYQPKHLPNGGNFLWVLRRNHRKGSGQAKDSGTRCVPDGRRFLSVYGGAQYIGPSCALWPCRLFCSCTLSEQKGDGQVEWMFRSNIMTTSIRVEVMEPQPNKEQFKVSDQK